MMKITEYFIQNKKLTMLMMIFVLLAGSLTMMITPRQDSPNVNFDIMIITTVYPGASPSDVEINVTDKLEDELEEVDGIDKINSYSVEGVSWIFVTVDPDSNNPELVKNDIKSAVDRVTDFPEAVENRPQVSELKTTDFPVLEVAVMNKGSLKGIAAEQKLRAVAKELENKLKEIRDVGGVDKIGYRKQEVQINASLKKMQDNQLSFSELIGAIKNHNIMLSGGSIESATDKKKIVTYSEFIKLDDVADVIVRSNFSGKNLKVNDIATIDNTFKKQEEINRTNGQEAINLIVKRKGNSDVLRLSDELNQVVKFFSKQYAAQGIEIKVVVDFSHYTRSLLNIVTTNALLGFVLVLVSLFIFLNIHTAFWVAAGIPISILGAYALFPLFGITTNQISLITIIMVLGMLVDDAIVVAENIVRLQEEGMSIKEAAVKGLKEVIGPVAATVTTTMIAFVPMYFISGIMGKFIVAIPTVLILTLGISLLEATTLLPAHLSTKKQEGHKERAWFTKLKKVYGRWLLHLLEHKRKSLTLMILGFLITGIFFGSLGRFELFPTEDFDLFYVIMEAPAGHSLEQTDSLVKKVEEQVATIPSGLMAAYKTAVGHHRTDEAAADPALHQNWAVITVYLHPSTKRSQRSEAIIEDLKKTLAPITGFSKLEVREMQDGPPVGSAIQLQIIGDAFEQAEILEEKILDKLKTMKGVYGIESSNRPGMEEVRLLPRYDRMGTLGITSQDIASTIRMAYDGQVATSLRRNGEEVDFRVQLENSAKTDVENIKKLTILNNSGRLIELDKVVAIEKGHAKDVVEHYQGKKSIKITAKVDSKQITSHLANTQIREFVEPLLKETSAIQIEYGGEEQETMKSFESFFVAFICGIVGIFFILVILTDSYFQPLLIMVAIPFGIVGVLVAFTLHGIPMSFLGLIGTLGMIGVVVNDSLVMVTHLNSLRDIHHRMTREIIVEGAITRLRPVLLTTITTLCGLMPTVYGWGGSEPFVVPMVLAMSYGLLFATIITLFLIPLLYTFVKEKAH